MAAWQVTRCSCAEVVVHVDDFGGSTGLLVDSLHVCGRGVHNDIVVLLFHAMPLNWHVRVHAAA